MPHIWEHAVIIGAGGAIGGALADALIEDKDVRMLHAFSRRAISRAWPSHAITGIMDLEHEDSIAAAAGTVAGAGRPVDLLIVATGLLHTPAQMPEKGFRDLTPQAMAQAFAVNTIGPALVLKHFLPLFNRQRQAVCAVLSARVGSLSDNRAVAVSGGCCIGPAERFARRKHRTQRPVPGL